MIFSNIVINQFNSRARILKLSVPKIPKIARYPGDPVNFGGGIIKTIGGGIVKNGWRGNNFLSHFLQ